MQTIAIERIYPNPEQPRAIFDEAQLGELAASIKKHGVIQPVVVEQAGDDYILHDGERRLRASKMAGLQEIPAVVVDAMNGAGPEQRLIRAMVANVQRSDLNPIEEARAYKKMRTDLKMSVERIAIEMGVSRARVEDRLELLRLDGEIQDLIEQGGLPRDRRLADALLAIRDRRARVELAQRLAWRTTIKASVKAAQKVVELLSYEPSSDDQSPAMKKAKKQAIQPEWNALFQVGRVPPWATFNDAVMITCDNCGFRDAASDEICGSCPLPDMISTLMKAVKK